MSKDLSSVPVNILRKAVFFYEMGVTSREAVITFLNRTHKGCPLKTVVRLVAIYPKQEGGIIADGRQ